MDPKLTHSGADAANLTAAFTKISLTWQNSRSVSVFSWFNEYRSPTGS